MARTSRHLPYGAVIWAALAGATAAAQADQPQNPASAASAKPKPDLPVYPYDLKDRQYEVIGEIKATVRKPTIFNKEASQERIYAELWEQAQKVHADAVINAKYGDSHITAFSWGATNATGTAIKFVQGENVAPAPAPAVLQVAPAEAVPPAVAIDPVAEAAPTPR